MKMYVSILICYMFFISIMFPLNKRITPADMCSRDVSLRWRGVFAVGVLLCHYFAQVDIFFDYPDIITKAIRIPIKTLATFAVSGFFFYSVYGFLSSLQCKGRGALHGYWKKKIFNIYIPMLFANMTHIIMTSKYFGGGYDGNPLLDILGIGYCNDTLWYIYEIFVWYLLFYVLAVVLYKTTNDVRRIAWILCIVDFMSFFILWMLNVQGVFWWTNTGLGFGAIYYLYHEQINSIINKYGCLCMITGAVFSFGITIFNKVIGESILSDLDRPLLCFGCILLMMSISLFVVFGNKFTDILGRASLPIYLFHEPFMRFWFNQMEGDEIVKLIGFIGMSIIAGIAFKYIYSYICKIVCGRKNNIGTKKSSI